MLDKVFIANRRLQNDWRSCVHISQMEDEDERALMYSTRAQLSCTCSIYRVAFNDAATVAATVAATIAATIISV